MLTARIVRMTLFMSLATPLACTRAPADQDAGAATSDPTSSACTKLGAPCTFAPGKLGTCVEVERPEGPSSFVCQSQH